MAERLAEAGLEAVDERFWLAVRGNITTLQDAGDWWAVCHQPLTPEIEDEELLAAALAGASRWSVWPGQLVRLDKGCQCRDLKKGQGFVHAASQSVDRTRIWPGCRHFIMLHVARSGCAAAGRTNRLKTQIVAAIDKEKMTIRLYNTKTATKQVLPILPDHVRLYACGPTV